MLILCVIEAVFLFVFVIMYFAELERARIWKERALTSEQKEKNRVTVEALKGIEPARAANKDDPSFLSGLIGLGLTTPLPDLLREHRETKRMPVIKPEDVKKTVEALL